ncbi:pyridoxamine 5'-phosphate oxidase family protein [Kordiimonas aquimaris]|uniref:pyridoxamine 5'-phosphate oxidase family protein n=1 Tax=Kordiimonas aquimaris TaxID=707591 RepID=UPI0021D2FD20|nr:pyridoxamine 5'-phosphate oxidase family protein [Kordiimonas aquimaris]
MTNDVFGVTLRNKVKRGNKRAAYDKETVYGILDSHFLCHVAFEVDGAPHIIPTSHWRDGNKLYWHGSSKSFMIKHLSAGNAAAVSVTLLDGLVLARSAFNTSVNYRSVICYGTPELVTDDAVFDQQMERFFEMLAPGRWPQLRTMTATERKATGLLEMEIDTAAAKVRAAPPGDGDEADHPVWAGVVPLETVSRAKVDAPEGAQAPLNHDVFTAYNWKTI